MKEVIMSEDPNEEEDVSFEIAELFQSFMLVNSHPPLPSKPKKINLQLRTVAFEGSSHVECKTHSSETFVEVDKSTYYVDDTFSNVKKISADKVTLQDAISGHIYKAKVDGNNDTYVLKSALRQRPIECLTMEIESLICVQNLKNIVSIQALVHEEDGRISGILLPFIEGEMLDEIKQATKAGKEKWISSVKDTVKRIHELGRVWGDAKQGNMFVANGDVVLIDFEGGFSPGWVDKGNVNTEQGDWQGVDRIVTFIENLQDV